MQLIPSFKNRLFYGWVVAAAFFVIVVIVVGIQISFGIFFKSIETEFDLTRAATSAILSTQMLLGSIVALLGGLASDKYHPKNIILLMGIFIGLGLILTSQTNSTWQLFITYSLLLSIGTSAVFVVTTSIIPRWFNKKRGSAYGLATAGAGLGPVLMAPFATFLISSLTWRMAYIIIGTIFSTVVILLSRLMKKSPNEIGAHIDGIEAETKGDTNIKHVNQQIGLSLSQAIRTRSFWLIIFVWLLSSSCIYFTFAHLVPHITDIGFSATEAASVISLMGASATVGRLLIGTFSDKIGRKRTAIISALLLSGAILWLVRSQELWMLYLFAITYGFGHNGFAVSLGTHICDTFGLSRIGAILGVLDIGFGIGAAIGPFIGGMLYDIYGNYNTAFIVFALNAFLVAILTSLTRRETKVFQ